MRGIRLIKNILIIFSFLSLFACGYLRHIPYQPNKTNISDPISIIKTTIEKQSPAYVNVQKVEATDQYFKVDTLEEALLRGSYPVSTIIYFENIGEVKILKSNYWWVELYDKTGAFLLFVYPLEENQTKRFVDAVYIMMERASTPR